MEVAPQLEDSCSTIAEARQPMPHNSERKAQRLSMDGDLVGPHCAQKESVLNACFKHQKMFFWLAEKMFFSWRTVLGASIQIPSKLFRLKWYSSQQNPVAPKS